MTTTVMPGGPSANLNDIEAPAVAKTVMKLLTRMSVGQLVIHTPCGRVLKFGVDGAAMRADIRLRNWEVFARTMKSGDIGFAESFIDGQWTTPDLAGLLKLVIANRQVLEKAVYGTWFGRLVYRIKHLLNRNSRTGSRKNIGAHYDLGNAFYEQWLDKTMSYSSGIFEGDYSRTLEQASWAKVDRALDLAGVHSGSRVLEIGCGWGGLAERAVGRGARIAGVTLSTEQLDFAHKRMERLGASKDQADLRLQDYRDIDDGPYDAVCSIEMFEAVGMEYWDSFFQAVHKQLKPGGKACIQVITIAEDQFDRYVKSTDFIQQYVFPGGMLPSKTVFREHSVRNGLSVVDEYAFGADYAETLKRWREDFLAKEASIRPLGFDTRFMRIWEFYLAYCEAAFDQGNTDVVQFTLQKPL